MKVFLCENIHSDAFSLLSAHAQIVSDRAELPTVDAIVTRNLRLDRAVLSAAKCLKYIAVHGTGVDGIDLDFCRAHGISVFNTPGENAASVAELIVTLALTLSHRVHLAARYLDRVAPPQLYGAELSGKTVGFVGAGNIARRAARMFSAFDTQILAYTPSLTPARAAEFGAQCVSFDELLHRSDVLAVCVPLTAETRGLIDESVLSCMKPTAMLINTARGGIVDETALYRALTSGTIAAAACDVFASEPPTMDNPLLTLDNFAATPHIGANTDEALRRVGLCAVQQLLDAAAGILPKFSVL